MKIVVCLLLLSTATMPSGGRGSGRGGPLFRWMALLALALLWPASALAIGARPLGMGSAYLAISDDENAVYFNPAGLCQVDRNLDQIAAQVLNRNDFQRDSFTHVGKIYSNSDKQKMSLEEYLETDYNFRSEVQRVANYAYGFGALFEGRSLSLNTQLGNFPASKDSSDSYWLAFATRFPIAEHLTRRPELYGGIRLRYTDVSRQIPSLSSKVGQDLWDVDLAGFYRANSRFYVGGTINSAYADTTHSVFNAQANDANFNLGVAYYYGEKRDTILAADYTNIFNAKNAPSNALHLGAERQFLDNDFVARIGADKGLLTLGFGVRFWEDFRLDYAFERGQIVDEHTVSVRLNF